ncbi:hypothetical protein [Phenylobacterium sp.]|uniref:hypothetical protein n=1 Tax=Phenylobacterium sp. TaxID=1871053 RepID=UPI0025D57A7B|nr:hypothetical protein [Phenylobacterium sp.]MBX3484570.1 hypothetical protein [Phenylobacterium sp.]MCW5759687.1 hypothetical protein [Phenylobacterium sp.]
MRRLLFPLLPAVLAASAVHAAPPPAQASLAMAFGNTVKALYADGKAQRIWFRPDGSWEAVGKRGKWSSGKWSLKDENKVCLKQSRPFPAPFKYCTEFPANGRPGVVWTSQDMYGEPIRLTVVRGIERP